MNEIGKVVKLDLVSIKPYFTMKNLLILLVLCFIFYFTSYEPLMAISMPLLFALLYSSYPFLVGEQSGLDALYRIFAIESKSVVIGRYVLSILLFFASVIAALVIYFVFLMTGIASSFNDLFINFGMYFIIYIFVVSFQYPFYFKFGYQKAKLVSMIGIFLFGAIAGDIVAGVSEIIVAMSINKAMLILIPVGVVTIVIAISMIISMSLYKNKDF